MNQELLNGPGCKDPTAYKAIRKVVADLQKEISAGSVVEYRGGLYVIISFTGDRVITVLKLHPEYTFKDYENPTEFLVRYKTRAGGRYVANTGVLQYLYKNDFGESGKKKDDLTKEEFEKLKKKMALALGISIQEEKEPQISNGVYKKLYEDLIKQIVSR